MGKEVHCSIDNEELKNLVPIQNNGTSAKNIAEVANELLESSHSVSRKKEKNKYHSDLFNNLKYILRRKVARIDAGINLFKLKTSPKIVTVIQARIGSSRLPGKVMLHLLSNH